ncbi:MAG: SgcJ/EcaC family oxidoreductase [Gemmatimonadales bacterium]
MDQLTATRHADRIRTLDESWMAAARRRDLDAMMAIYAPEAYELLPGMAAMIGRDAIREFYRQLLVDLPRFHHAFSMDEVTIAESADLAVVRGSYRFTFDEEKPDDCEVGKFVGVWVFFAGDWRLQINISNIDGEISA